MTQTGAFFDDSCALTLNIEHHWQAVETLIYSNVSGLKLLGCIHYTFFGCLSLLLLSYTNISFYISFLLFSSVSFVYRSILHVLFSYRSSILLLL